MARGLKDIFLAASNSGAETISVEGEKHAAKQPGPEAEQRVAALPASVAGSAVTVADETFFDRRTGEKS